MLVGVAGFAAALTLASAASQTSYAYDALGRVTRVDYANGTVVEYQYDAVGNRIAKTVTAAPAATWGQFTWGAASW